MASIQHKGFSQSQSQLSTIFKALAHPARIAILDKLIAHDRVMCKEIEIDFPLSQSSVSNHLKVLLESGVLGYEKVQNVTYYCVNPLILNSAQNAIKEIVKVVEDSNMNYRYTFFKTLPLEI